MKQWFAQLFIGKNNWVIPISNQFDMSIDNSPQRSTHANVGTNPCGEKEEFVVEKVPSRRPWKRHIVDTEGLNCRCKPGENTDDENHCEHHWAHRTHLNFELFRHHLFTQRVGLLHENRVAAHSTIVHHLPNLRLSMTDMCLFNWVGKEISQYCVQCH